MATSTRRSPARAKGAKRPTSRGAAPAQGGASQISANLSPRAKQGIVVAIMLALFLGALDQTTVTAPIVVRLDGTNAVEGRALLAEAARPEITVEETMLAAAATAVRLAGEA